MTIQRFSIGKRMSQAVRAGDTLYLAGQVADDGRATIEDQTRQVLAKLDALLKEAGADKSRLLAVNVFLPNIADFDAMNTVYDAWVDPANPPARACVEARLADADLRVEMTAVAYLG
ncbi:RidA family protein [Aureimonas populi]|uniref:RidA family protein n=1 Tax=Aureimonas populi TaxID=1701758 RepID=A0ABW5CM61_9HYPH|nr:RidA family protein [Aureimonas populi]